ncbi:MAG: hypothetical protein VKP62_11500 [Candidatus Sericytochromatia bacterium]|nr:hypothetical protein [Candidatus Sericytochromatia bacterium]
MSIARAVIRLSSVAAVMVAGLLACPDGSRAAPPEAPLRTPEPFTLEQEIRTTQPPRVFKPRVIRGTPLPVWRPTPAERERMSGLRGPGLGGYRPLRPAAGDLDSRWRLLAPTDEPSLGAWQIPRFAPRTWFRTYFPTFQENYPLGAIALRPEPIQRFEGGLGFTTPDGGQVDLVLSYLGLTISDRQLPDSRHQRDDFSLALTGGRAFPVGPVNLSLEGGYMARYLSVSNNMPPPATGRFLTSVYQLYHGPSLRTGLLGELGGGWRWHARLEGRPYLIAHGDEAVVAVGPLFTYVAEPALSWEPMFGTSFEAGYRLENTSSYRADFAQSMQGPFLECRRKF